MSEWTEASLGSWITLQRGFDITRNGQILSGSVPVVSSGGISSYHNVAQSQGPGVIIGRKGTLGRVHFMPGPYWPHDTTLWVRDFKDNDPRFVYYALSALDTTFLNVGSASPTLNRNHLHPIPVRWPKSRQVQRGIAEVLGALDDKIAANAQASLRAHTLADVLYRQGVSGWVRRPLAEVLTPISGGTPDRNVAAYWNGGVPWASAKDVASAANGVILGTEEQITEEATARTRVKPVPRGSVILTARGTVGKVARLGIDAAFNQSTYGFVPGALPPGLLYFTVRDAAKQTSALAHGSVFDTITLQTFRHIDIPMGANHEQLEKRLIALLGTVQAFAHESNSMRQARDALLPLLMSGKVRVKDAEKVVEGVV